MISAGRVRAATVIAVVLIALSVSFLAWRAAAPSQCAQLYPAADQWTVAGVLPDVSVGCPLRDGDLVTAAERQPTDVVVTTIDGGVTATVSLPLIPAQIAGRFLDAWSTMLFTVSLFGVACYAFVRRRADPAAGALLVLSSGLLGSSAVTVVGLPVGNAFGGWPLWLFLVNVVVSYQLAWGGLLCLAGVFPTQPEFVRSRPGLRFVIIFGPLAAVSVVAVGLACRRVVGRIRFTRLDSRHDRSRSRSPPCSACSPRRPSWSAGPCTCAGPRSIRSSASNCCGSAEPAPRQPFWCSRCGWSRSSSPASSLLPQDAIGLPGLIFVAGLTVALLRYRLFDLEKLLGRTLVYAALTLLVVVIYLGVVGLIAAVFSASAATPTAVAGAVVVAIVVNPLRVVLQRLVNRLLYGDRDDPYQALSRVAEQLTAAARRRVVLPAVAADVGRALRVPFVSIQWQVADEISVAEVGVRPRAGRLLRPAADCSAGRASAGSSSAPGDAVCGSPRPNGGCSPTCPGRWRRPRTRSSCRPRCSSPGNGWCWPGRRNAG